MRGRQGGEGPMPALQDPKFRQEGEPNHGKAHLSASDISTLFLESGDDVGFGLASELSDTTYLKSEIDHLL